MYKSLYLTINQMFRCSHVLVLYLLYIVTSDFFFFGLSPILYDITNRDAVVMFPVKVVH